MDATVETLVASYTDGLRQLADFLDAHPRLLPDVGRTFFAFADTAAELADLVRDLGACEKIANPDYVIARREFGQHALEVCARRDMVCERVKVGTRVVEVLDAEALRAVPIVQEVEDVFEWRCPPSLLGLSTGGDGNGA